MSVASVKNKLCFHCGTNPSAMVLQLKDEAGRLAAVLDNDAAKLGFYSPADGAVLHVIDTDPTSVSANGWLEDTSKVAKYVMPDEEYDKRDNTYRKYKAGRLAEDPTWTIEKEIAARKGVPFDPPAGGTGKPRAEDEEHQAAEAAALAVDARCEVATAQGAKRGAVRYVGKVEGLPPGWWVGLQYDEPVGKNDGAAPGGRRYFQCPPGYGAFVRPAAVSTGYYPPFDDDFNFSDEDEI